MNSREKFLSCMRMKNNDYSGVEIPKAEFGYWAGTIRRWFKEGLPLVSPVPDNYSDGIAIMANKNIYGEMEKAGDVNVQPVFGLDQYLTKFPIDYSPMFKKEIISQDDINITYKDEYGVTNKSTINITSLPMELDNPVKDRKSWMDYKQYYDHSTISKRLGGTNGGFLGFPRQIMGVTRYMMSLIDDPELMHDINSTFCDFLIAYYGRICRDIEVDCILIWEDMAYKSGSLISPAHYREFLTPYYKKIVSFAKEAGVDIIITDSDGYVEELIPLIVEAGVTGMYPFERAAGNDLLKIRKEFPNFQIMGGFDKRAMFAGGGKEAIDTELKIVEEMLKKGRYIPHTDHFVSEDCTYENFTYYRNRLNEIIDRFNNKIL
ncbi:MAG: hypothetical protein NTZ89_05425 [Actinobacteria bacterium]|nr:hypothetical protein [Actinomycetota bacterium]